MSRLLAALLAVLLALWLACALAGGLAAASIFPASRELPLSLSGYEAFIAAQPEPGRMLVAGFLAETVFDTANRLQLALASCALVLMLLQHAAEGGFPRRIGLRGSALALALAAFAALYFWAQPAFRDADATYRAAALEGHVDAALALKPAVDSAHALASNCAKVEVLALLVVIALPSSGRGRGKSSARGDRGIPVGRSARRG